MFRSITNGARPLVPVLYRICLTLYRGGSKVDFDVVLYTGDRSIIDAGLTLATITRRVVCNSDLPGRSRLFILVMRTSSISEYLDLISIRILDSLYSIGSLNNLGSIRHVDGPIQTTADTRKHVSAVN